MTTEQDWEKLPLIKADIERAIESYDIVRFKLDDAYRRILIFIWPAGLFWLFPGLGLTRIAIPTLLLGVGSWFIWKKRAESQVEALRATKDRKMLTAFKEFGFLYCNCYSPSHFYCPREGKVWGESAQVLYSTHPIDRELLGQFNNQINQEQD